MTQSNAALADPKKRPTGRAQYSAPTSRARKQARVLGALKTSFRLLAPFPDLSSAVADHLFCTPRRFPRKAWEREVLKSGTAFSVVSHGRALRGVRFGQGPKVLLVHGWEGRGTQLSAFIEPLVDAGFSVWTFDMPAHGSSPGTSTDVLEMADAISDFRAQQGDIDTIVAHSLGTMATAFAIDRGLELRRLVLLAPTSSPMAAMARMEEMLGFGSAVLRRLHRRMEVRADRSFADVEEGVIFRKVSAPTLIIHDPNDLEVPLASVEAICEETDARIRWLEGAGHRGVLTAPEALTATTQFIAEGAAAPNEWADWVRGDFVIV